MYCLVLLHQMHIFGIEITFSEIKNKPAFLKQVYKTINIHNKYKPLSDFTNYFFLVHFLPQYISVLQEEFAYNHHTIL